MRKNRAAILILSGSILLASSAISGATDLDNVNEWLTKPGDWQACDPFVPGAKQNPANPTFMFGKGAQLNSTSPLGACRRSGKFVWHPVNDPTDYWWVEVISNLRPAGCIGNSCLKDLIRVCSLAYVRPETSPQLPGGGPCDTAQGVGPGGCEVCVQPAP